MAFLFFKGPSLWILITCGSHLVKDTKKLEEDICVCLGQYMKLYQSDLYIILIWEERLCYLDSRTTLQHLCVRIFPLFLQRKAVNISTMCQVEIDKLPGRFLKWNLWPRGNNEIWTIFREKIIRVFKPFIKCICMLSLVSHHILTTENSRFKLGISEQNGKSSWASESIAEKCLNKSKSIQVSEHTRKNTQRMSIGLNLDWWVTFLKVSWEPYLLNHITFLFCPLLKMKMAM